MIINVHKYLILGAKEDLDEFFYRAQHSGQLEFISLKPRKTVELPVDIHNLLIAHKILRKLPLKKPYDGPFNIEYANQTAQRILDLNAEVDRLTEEKRLLEAEVFRVSPFGDFSMEDIDFIEREGKKKIQFWCMKTAKSRVASFSDEVFYIGTEYDLDYFITINDATRTYPEMIEMRIDRPASELKMHLSFIKESLHQVEAELKGFAGHIDFLDEAMVAQLNDHNLSCAKKEVSYPLENRNLFAIEAWVPQNHTNVLYGLIDGMAIHAEPILIEAEDRVPTYMENRGVNKVGEDLVKVYDTPATNDKDPSGWVFWFFALFFAIIIADAGYGLLYLGTCAYLKYKFPNMKGQKQRLYKMFLAIACFSVGWGILTSSYFGIDIDPKSFLGRLSLVQVLAVKKADYHLQAKDEVYHQWVEQFPSLASAHSGNEFLDGAVTKSSLGTTYEMLNEFSDNILIEFSLLIGVIHLSSAFARYLWRNWAGLGWIAFMVGGYLFFPKSLNATSFIHFLGWMSKDLSAQIGLQLIYCGIPIAVFLSILQKKLKGLGEVMTIVQVFSDVLSYLRLYALGLAGAIMATTFNDIGRSIGLVFGSLVVVFGHCVNILLGVMAGVIHGLRLNFIEWYHYCFFGGGKLFNPLMKLKSKE